MRLWRLVRPGHEALDGAGAARLGGRYVSLGRPVVSLACEAGLAVLIALRYVVDDPDAFAADYRLGWTEIDAEPCRAEADEDAAVTEIVDRWLDNRQSLLIAVQSRVLPEVDVILMNPAHPDAAMVPPLVTRPFRFVDCLHRPPMLDSYRGSIGKS
jgi:RES domain-containing protein